MNIHKMLQTEADELRKEFEGHDPLAFTRRLAQRIAEGERPAPARPVVRSERSTSAPRQATAAPAAAARAPQKRAQPDVVASGRADLRRDLEHLCAAVVSEAAPETLAVTLSGPDCDGPAARVVGCLMYGIGRMEWAEFWWGIAAGAEDELACHLLAVHYAGTGCQEKAALWRRLTKEVDEERLPGPDGFSCGDPAEMAKVLTVHVEGAGEQALLDVVAQWPAPPPALPRRRPVAERPVVRGRSRRRPLVRAGGSC